jgi:hypothetical protein
MELIKALRNYLAEVMLAWSMSLCTKDYDLSLIRSMAIVIHEKDVWKERYEALAKAVVDCADEAKPVGRSVNDRLNGE